jgi:hemoglobin-like flavoprotein
VTPEQIRLVQESFRELVPIREAVAAAFYDRLFKIDPSVKPVFANVDLADQGRKLMAALTFVVNGVEKPAVLVGPLQALGRRHGGYGVEERHYASVGSALIATLQLHFGIRFTSGLRAAWVAAFALVSGVMIAAAREEVPADRDAA